MTKKKTSLQKRRFDRIHLETFKDVTVRFDNIPDKNGDSIERHLYNLSYKGLGFKPLASDAKDLPQQTKIRATLIIFQTEIPIEMDILYTRDDFFGARIEPKNPADIEKIIRFISPLELGQSLISIEPKNIRQKVGEKAIHRWYLGKNNAELSMLGPDKKCVDEFRLVFNLYTIQGQVDDKSIKTAEINPAKLGYLPIFEPWPEDLAQWHATPNREILQQASSLIEAASQIDEADRQMVLDLIHSN